MNRIKFLSVVTVCSSLFVSLLNPTHCFSNEAAVASESTNTTKKDSPLNHLDFANEHYKQGLNYAKYGLYDEAIEMYKKSLVLEPNNTDAYKNMGIAYAQKGMPDNALKEFLGKNAVSLSVFEARKVVELLGRNPTSTELFIFRIQPHAHQRVHFLSPLIVFIDDGHYLMIASFGDRVKLQGRSS